MEDMDGIRFLGVSARLMLALQRQAQATSAPAPVNTGLALEACAFAMPSAAAIAVEAAAHHQDGQKVYIQFPARIAQGDCLLVRHWRTG